MEQVILHISDLHITLHTLLDGSLNKGVKSHLTTNSDSTSSDHFIKTFTNKINKDFAGKKLFLVITGDIADTGKAKEFEYAKRFVGSILTDLQINPANCLILPGDHDVNRFSLERVLEENEGAPLEKPTYLMNEVKYGNFNNLYKQIKSVEFPFDKIIIDHLIIDNKIVLLGINSNYHIGHNGGLGFIEIEKFKLEIETIKRDLNNPKLHYVAFWHHNILAGYENSNSGQWDFDNRRFLLPVLEKAGIKFVFTGNEHTSNAQTVSNFSINTNDCGALTATRSEATFSAYPIIFSDDIRFENRIYHLVESNGNTIPYYWNSVSPQDARQPETFDLFIKNTDSIPEAVELPHTDGGAEVVTNELVVKDDEAIFYDKSEISEKLYAIVRDKKLFHTGHFHWSDSSRAHNWIDVAKLLESHTDLYFAQNAVIDVINTFNLDENSDLIIGLGYEGNIISSKASIKFDIPYTSLPYSYRYNDHHDYEKRLNYDNSGGAYKRVLIITDVVNDGKTIRELIKKKEIDFFSNVEKIVVVSLFYTGHNSINSNILNYMVIEGDKEASNDYEVSNLEFYTVKSLRVEKCPYGRDYKSECFIYKDELSCVHLFYDEKDVEPIPSKNEVLQS